MCMCVCVCDEFHEPNQMINRTIEDSKDGGQKLLVNSYPFEFKLTQN